MITRLTLEIPLSLKRLINIYSASDNVTIKEYIIKLIEADIKKRKPIIAEREGK